MEIQPASLRIICYPDPRLRRPASQVEQFDASLRALALRMLDLMREQKGVGLAAPQVGVSLRIFVCNVTGNQTDDLIVVNPRWVDVDGRAEAEEGCLSIPDVSVTIARHTRCVLAAQDLNGSAFELEATDLAARCWQHEIDHLEGRLIIDRMSEADKIANRRFLKDLESRYKGPPLTEKKTRARR